MRLEKVKMEFSMYKTLGSLHSLILDFEKTRTLTCY